MEIPTEAFVESLSENDRDRRKMLILFSDQDH